MTCDICNIMENKEHFKFIYEDELCFAILHESPAIAGHTLVIPKKHSPILEELDDNVVEHLFLVCNKVSTLLFEKLQVHGTNILLNNGHDAGQELNHVVINVLPRKERDGLNFEWEPKKAEDNALKAIASRIRSFSEFIFSGKDILPSTKIKHEENQKEIKEEENFLGRAFRKIP